MLTPPRGRAGDPDHHLAERHRVPFPSTATTDTEDDMTIEDDIVTTIPDHYPAGTTAAKCLLCGEIRFRAPDTRIDPWHKHHDYCGRGDEGETALCEWHTSGRVRLRHDHLALAASGTPVMFTTGQEVAATQSGAPGEPVDRTVWWTTTGTATTELCVVPSEHLELVEITEEVDPMAKPEDDEDDTV